ncbi:MAG: cytochrome c family protein, partial [Hyphomicrobiales bacterium]
MDSFELNKIIGAVLGTLLFVMGVGFLAEAVYQPRAAGPGLTLPEPEGTEHAAAEEPAAAVPIGVLLASADVAAGANAAKKCQSCHNFAEGAGDKTGPELFGVVGRAIGGHAGFAYSPGMAEHLAKGDLWSYENLDAFLLAPKAFTPGTKMNFSGLKNDQERANVIAYLASVTPNAPAFPPADAAAAAAPEGTEPVATDANAVPTPTTTQNETAVEGTPTGGGT